MMYSLSIVFGPTGTNWRFLFKTAGAASIAADKLARLDRGVFGPNGTMPLQQTELLPVEITDDFGQLGRFEPGSIHGVMLEDLDQTKLAAIEMSVHNGRAQADAEQAMRADPKIMASAQRRQGMGGPPILAPMGNGFTR